MKKIYSLIAAAVAAGAFSANAFNVYISNETGWENPTLYAWGDVNDCFGEWPGAAADGSVVINGVTYLKYAVPAAVEGTNENLIFNCDSSKLKDVAVTLDKDLYFAAYSTGMVAVEPEGPITPPQITYHNLYVQNESGWSAVYVYAWATDEPELFGAWPGAASAGTETIGGVQYQKYQMQESSTAYNLIFNNNDKSQFDGPVVIPTEDVFVKITSDKCELLQDPRATYYTIYVEDNTGWENFYIYAYNPAGAPELFGGWPGAEASGSIVKDGKTYLTFPVKATDTNYNFIFNNGSDKQYDVEGDYVINQDYRFIANPEEGLTTGASVEVAGAEDGETRWFNLQGVQVSNPENGFYIMVKNGKTAKVLVK